MVGEDDDQLVRRLAVAMSLLSHWNCGSSRFPSAEAAITPPSEIVSSEMKCTPGFGSHA